MNKQYTKKGKENSTNKFCLVGKILISLSIYMTSSNINICEAIISLSANFSWLLLLAPPWDHLLKALINTCLRLPNNVTLLIICPST